MCRHGDGVRRRAPRDRAGDGADPASAAAEGARPQHDLRRPQPLRVRRLPGPEVRLPRPRSVQGA